MIEALLCSVFIWWREKERETEKKKYWTFCTFYCSLNFHRYGTWESLSSHSIPELAPKLDSLYSEISFSSDVWIGLCFVMVSISFVLFHHQSFFIHFIFNIGLAHRSSFLFLFLLLLPFVRIKSSFCNRNGYFRWRFNISP